jgi:type VII secretion-associated serine protease mycosin
MPGATARRPLLAVAAAVAALGSVATPVTPAAAAPVCSRVPQAAEVIAALPWERQLLLAERVWPLSRGGVPVAVIDTGVDGRHRQMAGRVLPGYDALTNAPGGDGDCDGHGTAVASVIAAAKVEGVGFAGLAPDATILPVRVADSGVTERQGEISAADMAEALRWAADHGARVINVSVYFEVDHAEIRAAVEYAQSLDVLVVAAVGNRHKDDGRPDPTPYPAAYRDVVGVGAINADGSRLPESYVGPFVDLVAPGGTVTTAAPGSGHRQVSGTSFAAPFVSATAALLLARGMTVAEVRRRLIATADPAPGPIHEYGYGVVNPYRALVERAAEGAPASAVPVTEKPTDQAALARERRWRADAARAGVAVAVVAVLAVLLVAAGPVARRGRRGGWRARRRPTPVEPQASDDTEQRFYEVPRQVR